MEQRITIGEVDEVYMATEALETQEDVLKALIGACHDMNGSTFCGCDAVCWARAKQYPTHAIQAAMTQMELVDKHLELQFHQNPSQSGIDAIIRDLAAQNWDSPSIAWRVGPLFTKLGKPRKMYTIIGGVDKQRKVYTHLDKKSHSRRSLKLDDYRPAQMAHSLVHVALAKLEAKKAGNTLSMNDWAHVLGIHYKALVVSVKRWLEALGAIKDDQFVLDKVGINCLLVEDQYLYRLFSFVQDNKMSRVDARVDKRKRNTTSIMVLEEGEPAKKKQCVNWALYPL